MQGRLLSQCRAVRPPMQGRLPVQCRAASARCRVGCSMQGRLAQCRAVPRARSTLTNSTQASGFIVVGPVRFRPFRLGPIRFGPMELFSTQAKKILLRFCSISAQKNLVQIFFGLGTGNFFQKKKKNKTFGRKTRHKKPKRRKKKDNRVGQTILSVFFGENVSG